MLYTDIHSTLLTTAQNVKEPCVPAQCNTVGNGEGCTSWYRQWHGRAWTSLHRLGGTKHKEAHYVTPFTQNSREWKSIYSDSSKSVIGWGQEPKKRWMAKGNEKSFGDQGAILCLECDGNFTGDTAVKTHQSILFKWVQCVVHKIYLNENF